MMIKNIDICILRAILCYKSKISLLCKDNEKSKECMDSFEKIIDKNENIKIEIKEIKNVKNDRYILFKNGSYIRIIEPNEQDDNQFIRGKRLDNKFLNGIQDIFIIDEREFENVINPFLNKDVINVE